MRRRNRLVTLPAAVALLALAGCAQRAPAPDDPAAMLPAESPELLLFVPCGLAGPYGEVADAFNQQYPEVKLRRTLENQLPLRNRIRDGARPDLFVSLGEMELDQLYDAGRVDPAKVVRLARAPLAVVAPPANPLSLSSLADLARPDVKVVCVANPETLSVGQGARQALQAAGLWEQVEPKLIVVQTAALLLSHVAAGKVDASIVYKSCLGEVHQPGDVPKETNVAYVADLPYDLYEAVHVVVCPVNDGPNPVNAERFIELAAQPDQRQHFVDWLFDPLADEPGEGP